MKAEYNIFYDCYRFELDNGETFTIMSDAFNQVSEYIERAKAKESIQELLEQSEVIYGLDKDVIIQDETMMDRLADELLQKHRKHTHNFQKEAIQVIHKDANKKLEQNPKLKKEMNERTLATIHGKSFDPERKDLVICLNDSLYNLYPNIDESGDIYVKYHTYIAKHIHNPDNKLIFLISQQIDEHPVFYVGSYIQEQRGYGDLKDLSTVIQNLKEIEQMKEILVAFSDASIQREITNAKSMQEENKQLLKDALAEIQMFKTKFNAFMEDHGKDVSFQEVKEFVINEFDMYADAESQYTNEKQYHISFDYGKVAGWITCDGSNEPVLRDSFIVYDEDKDLNVLEYVTEEEINERVQELSLETENVSKEQDEPELEL